MSRAVFAGEWVGVRDTPLALCFWHLVALDARMWPLIRLRWVTG
jgi:hypothetical protein